MFFFSVSSLRLYNKILYDVRYGEAYYDCVEGTKKKNMNTYVTSEFNKRNTKNHCQIYSRQDSDNNNHHYTSMSYHIIEKPIFSCFFFWVLFRVVVVQYIQGERTHCKFLYV